MRPGRAIGRVCALAIVIAVVGCGGYGPRRGQPEMPLPPGVEPAPKGIKFSVKVTPTRFKVGERVVLEATLFNDSEKRFKKTFETGCAWDYQVAGADMRLVGPVRVCDALGTSIELEPGELRMIRREWSGNDRYFDANEKVTPGSYKITAGFVEGTRVIPMADPVTVEVLPR